MLEVRALPPELGRGPGVILPTVSRWGSACNYLAIADSASPNRLGIRNRRGRGWGCAEQRSELVGKGFVALLGGVLVTHGHIRSRVAEPSHQLRHCGAPMSGPGGAGAP